MPILRCASLRLNSINVPAGFLQTYGESICLECHVVGSETWTFQKEEIWRLEAFEMWMWRHMMKVSWTEHKTNEEVLQMVDTEREMMDTLRSRQVRSYPKTKVQEQCSWIGY